MAAFIKTIGMISLFLSSVGIGFLKSYSIKKRCEKLQKLIFALQTVYEHVRHTGFELGVVLEKSLVGCEFLSVCNDRVLCCDNDLTKEDNEIINEFFSVLGKSAKKVECEHINATLNILKKQAVQAENAAAQKCKIWQTSSLCIGIAAVIMMI